MQSTSSSLINRIIGVITLQAPVYREIAKDSSALTPAIVITVLSGLFSGVVLGIFGGNLVGNIGSGLIGALIAWVITAFVLALVANALGGKTTTTEMLRITGFVNIVNVLRIIPCIGDIAAAVLGIIGSVLAIREAAGLDTGKAILVAILAIVAGLIAVSLIAFVFGVGAGVASLFGVGR